MRPITLAGRVVIRPTQPKASRPGFEPGPGPSEGPNAFRYTIETHLTRTSKRTQPTAGFAPASSCLQDRRLSQSSHVGTHRINTARARGVEPRKAVLEAAGSPRSTLV